MGSTSHLRWAPWRGVFSAAFVLLTSFVRAQAGPYPSLADLLDEAVALVHAEPEAPLRAMMAAGLYELCSGVSRSALTDAHKQLPEYVPVLALGGDPTRPPSVQAMPREHFCADAATGRLCLRGPRVSVELPELVATRVDSWTFRAVETVPCPLCPLLADAEGVFVPDPRSEPFALAMATAFVAAVRVIDASERWERGRIDWGREGRITVVPYAMVTDSALAYYDRETRELRLGALGLLSAGSSLQGFTGLPCGWERPVGGLFLDTVRNPDVVAHEASHAVLNTLKPGWRAGVAMVLHEGLADATAALVAPEDPAVLDRVLAATGGDLRRPNEAAALYEEIGNVLHRYADHDPLNDGEPSCRSVLDRVRLEDCGLHPGDVEMPAAFVRAGGIGDPHRAAPVIGGLVYEVFCEVFGTGIRAGDGAAPAFLRAQSVAGTLMLRSLLFLGEHRVSLKDFALALLRVDRDLYGSRYRAVLQAWMEQRGILGPGEDLAAMLRDVDARLPDLDLPPSIRDAEEVWGRVGPLASRLARECEDSLERRVPALRDYGEETRAPDVRLWSDTTDRDGLRTLRLHYEIPLRRLMSLNVERPPADAASDTDLGVVDVFASLVFDPAGRLIALNADEPLP